MTQADSSTRDRVIRLIAEILEIDPSRIQGSSRMREDLGMDSLASLELLSTLSEQLKVDLDIEEAMGIATVDDACAFVDQNVASQQGAAASVRHA